MSSITQAPPPSSTSSMPNSEASSNDQNTTKIEISSSSSSVNPPPTSPTSDGNSSQTVTDTTTTSSVFESESTPSSSSSSISTTNNDGSTSSGSTDVSAPTSVMRNSLSENPPSSTSSTDTITTTEITVTDTTTAETTPTSTTTEVPTTITSQSATSVTDTTSVESQITTSEATETNATTASTSPTTVTATTVSEPTTVTDATSETATTVSEPTTVTSETATTATTVSEPTTVTDTTSETATTIAEPTTVTSETATTVSEPTTVTDTTSETATTASEPTTVTDTASETVTTVAEPTTTSDVTTTDTSVGSSTVVDTESQTVVQTPTETATLTESASTILTETGTLSEAQTATETISAARSDTPVTSTLQTDSGSSSRPISTVISSASSSGSSPSTLVASTVTDALTDVNTSNLDILTQNSAPTAEALSLTSRGVTFTTTEFTTSTRPDGQVTTIPTMTRTITSSGNPTYTLQPNEFEKNKGTIAGVIVAAVVVAVIGIFVGVWYCRRRRGRAAGRRSSLSPFAEVAPSVLIPGHPSPAGDRSLHSQEWRPPLVGEVGDDDQDGNALRNVMSQRSSTSGHILPVSYRDRAVSPPVDLSDVTSLVSSGQASTIQFGTSLLSFDGAQQTSAISRFSDSSSIEGGVRTASLISWSAEPTPIDSRFSHASSTSGTIPIISPFADSFSTQEAARNSYWGTTRPSTPQSSLSGEDSTPKRSESMGSQRSAHAQSITSSERGWKEIEINENVPRPPGRASVPPIHDVVVPAVNPFEVENTPSLMSQVSLLNPPTRPPFHTTLTALIHQSRPPVLPEIPAVASPALTDDSFHPEGLLADHLYVQGKSADNVSRGSLHSLLDHVDYSRPIVDSPRESAVYDGDIAFRMSRGTETSTEEGGVFDSSENPFRDPVPNDEDLFNDVSPVLTMLQRGMSARHGQ